MGANGYTYSVKSHVSPRRPTLQAPIWYIGFVDSSGCWSPAWRTDVLPGAPRLSSRISVHWHRRSPSPATACGSAVRTEFYERANRRLVEVELPRGGEIFVGVGPEGASVGWRWKSPTDRYLTELLHPGADLGEPYCEKSVQTRARGGLKAGV